MGVRGAPSLSKRPHSEKQVLGRVIQHWLVRKKQERRGSHFFALPLITHTIVEALPILAGRDQAVLLPRLYCIAIGTGHITSLSFNRRRASANLQYGKGV